MCLSHPAPDRRALLTGLAALPFAGCSENAETGRRQLAFVPDDQLAGLADQAWAEIIQRTPVSRDAELRRRLVEVGEPITRATGRDDLAWEFVIFDSPELNAFVLPNGKVGVFRGMMDFVEDAHELGAVVGHEAAHILARHPAERVSQQLATQAGASIAGLLLGGENGQYADLVAGAFGLGATYGVLLPHSRAQELEADRVGVRLMQQAGLDPRGAVRFWERMMERAEREAAPPEALSTHPADARRVEELRKAVGSPARTAGY